MKPSKLIQACLISAVLTLAACGKKDANSPKAKAPVDPAQAQAQQKIADADACSNMIEDLYNSITNKDAATLEADQLALNDKACDKLSEEVQNKVCRIQTGEESIALVSKALVAQICDPVKAALAAKTKTTTDAKQEEKTENNTAPVKMSEVKMTAPPKGSARTENNSVTENNDAVASKKVTELKKGLTLKLNRPDVFEGVRATFSKVQEGLYVESEKSLDAKKGTCYLDGTDVNLVFAKDQIFTFTKIEATEKGLSLISENPKVQLTCLKAAATPNPTTEWTIQDVQSIMDEAADVSEAK